MIPLRDDIPSKRFPFITILLILINVAVFIYQLHMTPQSQQEFVKNAGAIPANIFPGSGGTASQTLPVKITLLTSLFLHGGLLHITGNMLFLWIFGDNVEDKLGHIRFAVFYLVCGITAALTHVWHNPESGIPLIGASGAISGVLGAYLLFFPRARIQTLVFIGIFITTLRIPALVFIAVWAILQFVNISRGEPHIAWLAHIGGFITGVLAAALVRKPDG